MTGRQALAWIVLTSTTLFVGAALAEAQELVVPPLFTSQEPLEITLAADFDALRGDRDEDPPERPAVMTLHGDERLTFEAQLRTRGRFRIEAANCSHPPIRLNLKKGDLDGTVFQGQDKLKVVGVCRDRGPFEQYVLKEYLAYRVFEMVSPSAFRTRLVRITYLDVSGENDTFTRYGYLIEDDDVLAERLGGQVFELPENGNLPPEALDPVSAATVAVFQYMIGNTDWSDVAGHNMELVDVSGIAVPVPFDFDFSGLVDAPYANPDPELNLGDVKERLYRGWCWEGLNTGMVLDRFRGARQDILGLFQEFPFLDDGVRSQALDYLGAFFDGIDTDEKAERRLWRDCRAVPSQ